jgi:Lon protease-like protein
VTQVSRALVLVATDIPLFPLGTVLFPGGLLPLRIFETRYVDMVSRCMRQDETFGVVLIETGAEVGSVGVETASVGTTARIIDFQTLEGGLLGLLCRGEKRFRIGGRSQQADGLNRAMVEWIDEPESVALDARYAPLVRILSDALGRVEKLGRFITPAYDDAGWVSYRLTELMPLPVQVQQKFLELDDPDERLRLLAPLLEIEAD